MAKTGRPKKDRKLTSEIHVALELPFLEEINDYVEQSTFKSRTQFIVHCIKKELRPNYE